MSTRLPLKPTQIRPEALRSAPGKSFTSAQSPVQIFADQHGLQSELNAIVAVVTGTFDLTAPLAFDVRNDDETGESWIEISAEVRGSSEQVIAARREYMRKTRACVSTGGQERLRLFLTVADN